MQRWHRHRIPIRDVRFLPSMARWCFLCLAGMAFRMVDGGLVGAGQQQSTIDHAERSRQH
jgi:hypothetical protein